jgi:hypothetical protein
VKNEIKNENLLFDESIVNNTERDAQVICVEDEDDNPPPPVLKRKDKKSALEQVIIMIEDSDDEQDEDDDDLEIKHKIKNIFLHESLYLEDARDKLNPTEREASKQSYQLEVMIMINVRLTCV